MIRRRRMRTERPACGRDAAWNAAPAPQLTQWALPVPVHVLGRARPLCLLHADSLSSRRHPLSNFIEKVDDNR